MKRKVKEAKRLAMVSVVRTAATVISQGNLIIASVLGNGTWSKEEWGGSLTEKEWKYLKRRRARIQSACDDLYDFARHLQKHPDY